MFITFEGIEGCGKSTQAKRLFERLKGLNIPVICTFEPGGTGAGQAIRGILLDARNQNLTGLAELLLYAADRTQHVKEVIKPALERGMWVVCDRFFDATSVYQGHARRQDKALVRVLNEKACQGIRPDITFLLDCPVEIGLERAIRRNLTLPEKGQDRFERERKAFHEAVKEGYLRLASEEKKRFVVLDATLEEADLAGAIFEHIARHIPRERG